MCWWTGEWIGLFGDINYGKIKRKRVMILPWTLISWAKNHSLKSLLKVSNVRKVERNCNTQTLNLKYVSFEAPLVQDSFDLQFPTCHGVESRPKTSKDQSPNKNATKITFLQWNCSSTRDSSQQNFQSHTCNPQDSATFSLIPRIFNKCLMTPK